MTGGLYSRLYAALGLTDEAGPEELRRAYLALAVKYHPDRNPGDTAAENRFKEISEAYAILSDPAAKARYGRMQGTRAEKPAPSSAEAGRTGAEGPAGDFSRRGNSEQEKTTGGTKAEEGGEPDWEETLAAFFKSSKGRDLLKDMAGELKKAGLDFKADDFAAWLKKRRPGRQVPGRKNFWQALVSLATGAGPASGRRQTAADDFDYSLRLGPREAAAGFRFSLSHQAGPGPAELLVIQIPPGVKNGEVFFIPGLGPKSPDDRRGDLLIRLQVAG